MPLIKKTTLMFINLYEMRRLLHWLFGPEAMQFYGNRGAIFYICQVPADLIFCIVGFNPVSTCRATFS